MTSTLNIRAPKGAPMTEDVPDATAALDTHEYTRTHTRLTDGPTQTPPSAVRAVHRGLVHPSTGGTWEEQGGGGKAPISPTTQALASARLRRTCGDDLPSQRVVSTDGGKQRQPPQLVAHDGSNVGHGSLQCEQHQGMRDKPWTPKAMRSFLTTEQSKRGREAQPKQASTRPPLHR